MEEPLRTAVILFQRDGWAIEHTPQLEEANYLGVVGEIILSRKYLYVPHNAHLIITLLTAGCWLPIWVLLSIIPWKRRIKLMVNNGGVVIDKQSHLIIILLTIGAWLPVWAWRKIMLITGLHPRKPS